jgi:hypothetical protein
MWGGLAPWGWVFVGAGLILLGIRWYARRRAARFLDGALHHLQGGPRPDFMQTDPDRMADAVDAAADAFFGLPGDEADAALLARFAAAEQRGIPPEDLLVALWERCGLGPDDAVARRAVVLCVTRPDQTHRVPRLAFDEALRLAGDDPALLQCFAQRTQLCIAQNPYLYLDMPDGAELRAAAEGTADDNAARALVLLAQEHEAAVARALRD